MQTDVESVAPIIRHAWWVICPRCQQKHQMPSECLRHEWQAMACDACDAALEYRGQHTPTFLYPEDYEVQTRLAVRATPTDANGEPCNDESGPHD